MRPLAAFDELTYPSHLATLKRDHATTMDGLRDALAALHAGVGAPGSDFESLVHALSAAFARLRTFGGDGGDIGAACDVLFGGGGAAVERTPSLLDFLARASAGARTA